jgi:hypothetical protein
MSTRPCARTAASLALITLLAACGGQSRSVTANEPDAYDRAHDPLLEAHASPDHKAMLKERCNRGQTERLHPRRSDSGDEK